MSEAWAQAAAEKPFPQENADAWLLGSPQAFWAISKQTGGIRGGWYAPRRERCLDAVEGAYFVEDRQGLRQAAVDLAGQAGAGVDQASVHLHQLLGL